MMKLYRPLLVLLVLLGLIFQPLAVLGQGTPEEEPESESEVTGETISLEVPDCPGILRDIDARNVPPSIYPKPCEQGTGVPGDNPTLGGATGEYGSGLGAPPAGTLFWKTTCDQMYNITQGMGTHAIDYSNYDYTLGVTGHPGVDVGMPVGSPLCSPVAGTVAVAGGSGFFYNTEASRNQTGMGELKIRMSNGDEVILGHMSRISVSVGQTVSIGQSVGDSGYPSAPHLHLEYRQAGHPETVSTFLALDPREVFGVPAGSTTPGSGAPTTPNVPSTSSGAVNSMGYFQQKYGFISPTGTYVDLSQHAANFAILRDWAIKAAPLVDVEAEMIAWWTVVETREPYDSYSYSNCGDVSYEVDLNCGSVYSGGWQVGYGQQYVFGSGLLTQAFQDMRGSPTDTALVQRLGQEVLDKAGIAKTFPAQNIPQLIANGSFSSQTAGNYWLYTIMRDPAVSAYLLGAELAADIGAAGNSTLMDHMCNAWGSSYYCAQETKQKFADGMNDVLKAWGIAGSGTQSSAFCTTTGLNGTGCSTEADVFNGMDVDEFVAAINASIDDYKRIAACASVPWEMMAAIHHRETALIRNFTGNNGGPWQLDPPPAGVDAFNFFESGCWAAEHLAGKASDPPLSGTLRPVMDPNNSADAELIKHAFFGYNGRDGFQGNVDAGKCTPRSEGASYNWDCSAYVMNNWDSQHTDMCISGSIDGGAQGVFCDGIDGAWKTYYKLVFSTYGADGKLLVYGGKCVQGNPAVDGIAMPTDAGKTINSQFFNSHIGIDIGNNEGDAVYAIADGEVVRSRWTFPSGGGTSPTGYYIILKVQGASGERWVYYGHLAATGMVPEGSTVTAGQQIGTTGAQNVRDPNGNLVPNGITGGPHLHFDIRTTQGEGQSISQHVNPCLVPGFEANYTGNQAGAGRLICPGNSGGAPW